MGTQEQFVYDSTGNIIQFDEITLSYGAGDRLERRGESQYYYDGNGRLIKKVEPGTVELKVWLFSWDAEDQLRSVTTPNGEVWEYQYDALGRRIVKQGPEQTIRLVWDGDVVAHEVENEAVKSYWVFDPEGFAPLAKIQNEQLYSVICDHLGTPKELLDKQGRVVWAVSYRAWGTIDQIGVEEVDCPIRFPGQWADAESGLYYNRFRFYDPENGRFVSSDPIRLLGGLNCYLYINNPIKWVDPIGLSGRCFKHFFERVKAKELEGSRGTSTRASGHARSKHGVRNEVAAEILNHPERIFSGINKNGNPVDIYYSNGSVVITDAGNKRSVITAYGQISTKGSNKPAVPSRWVESSKWQNGERYVEINRSSSGMTEVIYPDRQSWEENWY